MFCYIKKEAFAIEKELKVYADLMERYTTTMDKNFLYRAEQISNVFIKNDILPAELVRIHNEAMKQVCKDMPEQVSATMDFLLEAMIAYGVAHKNYQKVNEEKNALRTEIQIAANMQKDFLKTRIPQEGPLDIGVISVPYSQMNGDYYHFIEGKEGSIGMAIADVIGKGVPAALSMSMIKYSMDGFKEMTRTPRQILRSLNRVVEKNVSSNMFITMFYAQYNIKTDVLSYASAGHEPGFYYEAKTDTYHEFKADGLVLGVLDHTDYNEHHVKMQVDDRVILLTDGVTECKYGERFITRAEVLEVIKKFMYLTPKNQVAAVYNHFENLPEFELKDDFTLLIFEKKV